MTELYYTESEKLGQRWQSTNRAVKLITITGKPNQSIYDYLDWINWEKVESQLEEVHFKQMTLRLY